MESDDPIINHKITALELYLKIAAMMAKLCYGDMGSDDPSHSYDPAPIAPILSCVGFTRYRKNSWPFCILYHDVVRYFQLAPFPMPNTIVTLPHTVSINPLSPPTYETNFNISVYYHHGASAFKLYKVPGRSPVGLSKGLHEVSLRLPL